MPHRIHAEHQLLASIDDMLSFETLGMIEGRSLHDVRRLPFHSVDSLSGSQFLRVETDDGHGAVRSYVVKRISPEWDWIMRATGDRGRAVLAWQTGLLDRLPDMIDHAVASCCLDGRGHAILMRDLGTLLVPPRDSPISMKENERFLDAMAAMHARFWGAQEQASAERGFCSLQQHYQMCSPATGQRESRGPDPTPRLILKGWALLPELVESDVHQLVASLLDDPQPLCDALAPHIRTVIHGDWKLGNLGLHRGDDRRIVLLDWDRVGAGPAAFDLGWYLGVNSARLPVSKETVIDHYRNALESALGSRFDRDGWQVQLDLSLLGAFVQLGWPKLLGAVSEDDDVRYRERAELAWWSERVREGARRLG